MYINRVRCDLCGFESEINGSWLTLTMNVGYDGILGSVADGDSFSGNICDKCVMDNELLQKCLVCFNDSLEYSGYQASDVGKTLHTLVKERRIESDTATDKNDVDMEVEDGKGNFMF